MCRVGGLSPASSATRETNCFLVTSWPSVRLNTSPTAAGLSAARKIPSTRFLT